MACSLDFEAFVDSAKAQITKYSENTAYNSIKRFMNASNDSREPETLEPEELDELLCCFFISGKNWTEATSNQIRCQPFDAHYKDTLLRKTIITISFTMKNLRSLHELLKRREKC